MRERVIQSAMALVGTPYKRLGRTAGVGLDCIGLIVAVGESLGISLQPPRFYRYGNAEQAIAGVRSTVLVPITDLWSPGTVVIVSRGRLAHFAIPTHEGVVEARNDRGVGRVIHTYASDELKDLVVAAFEFPGECA